MNHRNHSKRSVVLIHTVIPIVLGVEKSLVNNIGYYYIGYNILLAV